MDLKQILIRQQETSRSIPITRKYTKKVSPQKIFQKSAPTLKTNIQSSKAVSISYKPIYFNNSKTPIFIEVNPSLTKPKYNINLRQGRTGNYYDYDPKQGYNNVESIIESTTIPNNTDLYPFNFIIKIDGVYYTTNVNDVAAASSNKIYQIVVNNNEKIIEIAPARIATMKAIEQYFKDNQLVSKFENNGGDKSVFNVFTLLILLIIIIIIVNNYKFRAKEKNLDTEAAGAAAP